MACRSPLQDTPPSDSAREHHRNRPKKATNVNAHRTPFVLVRPRAQALDILEQAIQTFQLEKEVNISAAGCRYPQQIQCVRRLATKGPVPT